MDGILIIYIGMDHIKGELFNSTGHEIIVVDKKIDLIINEEYVEQDGEQWYSTIIDIVKEMQDFKGDTPIKAISITYQPGTFICIDRSGRPLMNAILSADKRARYQVHVCQKRFKKYDYDFNVSWNHMILPRLMWIKYNKPDVYKDIFKVLTPDGYISYRLSGEAAVDNCSAMFLGYNSNTCSYHKKVINNLGLDANMFPDVKRIGDCAGIIAGDAAKQLNLKSEVEFLISTNCMVPLFYKAGAFEDSIIYDAESSSCCFAAHSSKKNSDSIVFRLPVGGLNVYGIMGSYESLFLKWLNDWVKITENDETNYLPGSNGIMALPYLLGDNYSLRSDIKGSIIGISNNNSYDIVTAVYEAVGYILKEKLEYISRFNDGIQSIQMSTHIDDRLFFKIISDITGKNVYICSKDDNIIKHIFSLLLKNEVKYQDFKEIVCPDAENYIKYRQLGSLYRSAYDSLNEVFKYRRRIAKKVNV